MQGRYIVTGGHPLAGEVMLQGAKNAVLPILAASLLCRRCQLLGCPDLTDVDSACHILEYLGCRTRREGDVLTTEFNGSGKSEIPAPLMEEMRSSIIFLSVMIARYHQAVISMPGGCQLGPRPIDYHLAALEKMGVQVRRDQGKLYCRCEGRLTGAQIALPFPSVGATETVLLAAVTARGETVLTNAAREPEIADLIGFLRRCGAKIRLCAGGDIAVEGVDRLEGCIYPVMADRIVLSTYLSLLAAAGGEICIRRGSREHNKAFCHLCETMGMRLWESGGDLYARAAGRLKSPGKVRTMPYPGFPTDSQPMFLAACTLAEGTSVFTETIFENRFGAAYELGKMGARINIADRIAIVEGVPALTAARLRCPDLRGGASLVVAAAAAEGSSTIEEIHHILRGYENFARNLRGLGVDIIEERG